jgi:hypothetical protein
MRMRMRITSSDEVDEDTASAVLVHMYFPPSELFYAKTDDKSLIFFPFFGVSPVESTESTGPKRLEYFHTAGKRISIVNF